MYRTLTYPELLRRLTYRCPLLDDIISDFDCPLFDIISHKKSLHSLFFTIYAGVGFVMNCSSNPSTYVLSCVLSFT